MPLLCLSARAQEPEALDSAFVRSIEALIEEHERMTDPEKWRGLENAMAEEVFEHDYNVKKELAFDYSGATTFVKGLIHSKTQHGFVEHPALFANRHFGKEDYAVALTPVAINYVMKLAGVKSRSKWNRMITANAMGLAMHVGLTEGLKRVVTEVRPNGEDDRSFPSGHTSLAFLSATILSREYGYKSPWITVGAYSCATATQFLRQRHNNHWINDTFMGAGIGMMSANVGYFLSDLIYGEKGLENVDAELRRINRTSYLDLFNRPCFTLVTGSETGNKTIGAEDIDMLVAYGGDVKVETGAAFSVGVDYNQPLGDIWGIEAIARMSTAHAKVYAGPDGGALPAFTGSSMSMYHFDLGSYMNVPLDNRSGVGVRAFAGVRNTQGLSLDTYSYDATGDVVTSPFLKVEGQTKFELGGGVTLDMFRGKNYLIGFVFDYHHAFGTGIMPNRYTILNSWKMWF